MCCNDPAAEAESTDTLVGHCKRDETDVYIGRGPNGTALGDVPIGERGWLGNPFPLEKFSREESIARFDVALRAKLNSDEEFAAAVRSLSGERLGCWCQRLTECEPACHGEVIAHYADELAAANKE